MDQTKAIFFAPLVVFMLFFLALVIGFIILIIKIVTKSKKQAWQGEIIDKIYNTYEDFDTDVERDLYTLVIKTDVGKNIKYNVSQQAYEQFKVGDKVEKKSGKFLLQKIS